MVLPKRGEKEGTFGTLWLYKAYKKYNFRVFFVIFEGKLLKIGEEKKSKHYAGNKFMIFK